MYGEGPLGHLNVHWLAPSGVPPVFSPTRADDEGTTYPDLWPRLRGLPALTIPHRPANHSNRACPRDHCGPETMPVLEIFQEYRGSDEFADGPTRKAFPEADEPGHRVRDTFDRGLRIGCIADSAHHGVTLGGLYVGRLDGDGVLEALNARRTF